MTKSEVVRAIAKREASRGKKVCYCKVKSWSNRQLKKARWKRSLSRAVKRETVYGGYVNFTDELEIWHIT